jgi:hypothetical protein
MKIRLLISAVFMVTRLGFASQARPEDLKI